MKSRNSQTGGAIVAKTKHGAAPISVVVPVYNEELNIAACLESVCSWADEVVVVDAGSQDDTLSIARYYTDKTYQHDFGKHKYVQQKNWILEQLPLSNEWLLFLDADERVTPELHREITRLMGGVIPSGINGFYVGIQLVFMGREIRHGGYYPNWGLRLFRRTSVRFIEVDGLEYAQIRGETLKLRHHILHTNNKDLSAWINKQNERASIVAAALIRKEAESADVRDYSPALAVERSSRVWMRKNIWYKLPLLVRPLVLWTYRYVLRLGFLDGIEGLIFITLLNFWYPFLVDAKYIELKRQAEGSGYTGV